MKGLFLLIRKVFSKHFYGNKLGGVVSFGIFRLGLYKLRGFVVCHIWAGCSESLNLSRLQCVQLGSVSFFRYNRKSF